MRSFSGLVTLFNLKGWLSGLVWPPLSELGASTEDGSGKDGSTNEVAYAFFFSSSLPGL